MNKFLRVLNALISPFLSRKLWMALVAIWMIYGIYWASVKELYSIPDNKVGAFQSLTLYMFGGVSTIALWYIGVQGAANWRGGNSVSTLITSALSSETKEENINIHEEKLLKIETLAPKDIDEEAFE